MNQYDHYRAVDFAQDEYFQQWVWGTDPQATAFWEHWSAEHPEQRAEVAEGHRILLALGPAEESVDAQRAARMKRAIFARLSPNAPPPRRNPVRWRWAAAVLALLLLGGGYWSYQQWAYVRYATSYGERKSFVLPDGSEVTLKANSRLRYARDWTEQPDREVWLTGEAFFHVRQRTVPDDATARTRPSTFVVHATPRIDVAVLGTEFNVNTRDEATEVMLKSGSVRVDVKHQRPQTLLMKPGDLVAIEHRRGTLVQQQVDLPDPAAWEDNMLIFDEVTLAEVARKLRYTYGVEIVFEDRTLARRKFKGFVPTDNLDVLLEAFEELYNVQIERNDNQLIFSKIDP